jgi:hypothetical protein
MKQLLTPRNIAIALAVVIVAWLLWPSKKKPAPTETAVSIPRPGSPINTGQPLNVADAGSKDQMGPSIQARQVSTPVARETLVRLEERKVESSKTTF